MVCNRHTTKMRLHGIKKDPDRSALLNDQVASWLSVNYNGKNMGDKLRGRISEHNAVLSAVLWDLLEKNYGRHQKVIFTQAQLENTKGPKIVWKLVGPAG